MYPYTNLVIAIPHAVGCPAEYDWSGNTKVVSRQARFTDWHTDKLFASSMENVTVVLCPFSRLDVDVERLEHEPDRICNFWNFRQGTMPYPTNAQTNRRLAEWFRYRAELLLAASRGERPLLLDCHSFSCDLAPDVDVCLGYNDDSSRPLAEDIKGVSDIFRDRGYVVAHNRPYANAIAPEGYRGHSLMIEVNKRCYLDTEERSLGGGFDYLRQTLEELYCILLGRDNKKDSKKNSQK